jgi:phytol kinase
MLIMLAFLGCIVGLFLLLVIAELLGEKRILKGEYHRKFFHITSGIFIAFWPWIISWHSIQILALLMIVFVIANRNIPIFSYHGRIGRASFGDSFLALAILLSAGITHNKVFFAIAILQVALADGLAAGAGIKYGKNWDYVAFGFKKTVIGSMVFWIVSACVLAVGILSVHELFSFQNYYLLVTLLPPFLTLTENASIFGLDNLTVPLVTILALQMAQI